MNDSAVTKGFHRIFGLIYRGLELPAINAQHKVVFQPFHRMKKCPLFHVATQGLGSHNISSMITRLYLHVKALFLPKWQVLPENNGHSNCLFIYAALGVQLAAVWFSSS